MKSCYALYCNILYMHFSERFLQLPDSAKSNFSPKGVFSRLLKVIGYTLLRLVGNLFKQVEHPEKLEGKIWLYVLSQNNYESLNFLEEGLEDAVFVAGQSKQMGKYKHSVQRISLRRKLFSYYKFPTLFFRFIRDKKKITLRFFDLLFDAVGFYEVYLLKLQKYKPKAIVFANDHNADARAMMLAAKALGIKTIYIQHASVSLIFPPLTFDLNLLEGQDALDKYKLCGPINGKVHLVGMPKFDEFVTKRNNRNIIGTVGIGCNLLDDLEEVEKLLRHLNAELPGIKFIIRPHPRDKRNVAELVNIAPNIKLSDSSIESVFKYLQQLDVQVSGNSGIHLEAVLINVWSIFYDFNPKQPLDDYYGFIKNSLVDVAGTPEKLSQLISTNINTRPEVFKRARYYNATVGTAHEGKSADKAIKLITSFIKT